MGVLHLYIDESGVRMPDYAPEIVRRDNMDYFAFGGLLIEEDDIDAVRDAHSGIVDRWGLDGPLHSTKIRGRRKQFAWLAVDPARESDFLADLETTILGLPVIGAACVVDRPGYVARYAALYQKPWLLCKTAFAILVERAAKYARAKGHRLKIFYEEAGQNEDRDLEEYARLLRTQGMPFDRDNARPYSGLEAADFQSIIIGVPQRITKKVPMVQFSDMILYPIAKGGYEPNYRPYVRLMGANRLLDCHVDPTQKGNLGIKYSCFDAKR